LDTSFGKDMGIKSIAQSAHHCISTRKSTDIVLWCGAYFDILSRLGLTHECDRQTDRQTEILAVNAALNCVQQ